MDILLSVIASIVVTWVFAHAYYKASKKQDDEFRSKLSNEVRKIILSSDKKRLTVKELNELLELKIYKSDDSDPLPFLVCPKCGSKDLIRSSFMNDSDVIYSIKCGKCDWSDWTE